MMDPLTIYLSGCLFNAILLYAFSEQLTIEKLGKTVAFSAIMLSWALIPLSMILR